MANYQGQSDSIKGLCQSDSNKGLCQSVSSITLASLSSKLSSHIEDHCPLVYTSTRPESDEGPETKRKSVFNHIDSGVNTWHIFNQYMECSINTWHVFNQYMGFNFIGEGN